MSEWDQFLLEFFFCVSTIPLSSPQVRAAREFPEDLVRISIGIESADDLIADLSRAMQSYVAPGPSAAAKAAAVAISTEK